MGGKEGGREEEEKRGRTVAIARYPGLSSKLSRTEQSESPCRGILPSVVRYAKQEARQEEDRAGPNQRIDITGGSCGSALAYIPAAAALYTFARPGQMNE